MFDALSFGIGFGTGVAVGGTAGVLIGRQWERNSAFGDYLAAEEGGEYDGENSEIGFTRAANVARQKLAKKAEKAREGKLAKVTFDNELHMDVKQESSRKKAVGEK